MNCDPLNLALQHVSETKHLLDSLLTSSERFDYPKAKLALQALRKKVRDLTKLQAELTAASIAGAPSNVVMLPTVPSGRLGVRP